VEGARSAEEWSGLPKTEIARMCAGTESFVRKIKSEREEKESHNATPSETRGEPVNESDAHVTKPSRMNFESAAANGGQTTTPETETAEQPRPANFGEYPRFWSITVEGPHRFTVTPNRGSKLIFINKGQLIQFICELEEQIAAWTD
jgi:hypothetical protein